jgi:hypothetical protein
MAFGGGTSLTLRFRPNPETDGAFERPDGAPIPVSAPDWDRALDLLRKINSLRDSSGRRVSALLREDGFEPWWYGQDRLLRFYLVPLTQLLPVLPLLDARRTLHAEGVPPDLARVFQAIGGREGFACLEGAVPPPRTESPGRWAMWMLAFASLAAFRLARRDTVFYIIDHVSPGRREDFRFSPLYRELERGGFAFAEYAHTLSPYQALKNFFRRGRPVFFIESADFHARLAPSRLPAPDLKLPSGGPATAEDRALRALLPTVIEGCLHSIARQRVLKRALRFQQARRALIFDDNRHNFELTAACLALGIPVLGFQHGVFNKFHAGLMAFGFSGPRPHAFDRYGVWSELFRERLLRDSTLFSPERVFIAGPVRPPERPAAVPQRPPKASSPVAKVRVLVVSEPLARKREVAPFLQALRKDTGVELYLKLRPGESEKSLEEYSLSPADVRLIRTGTVYEAFAQVDAAVGTYSSVLYEAALALIPVVWMNTTRAYGRELAEEGLAETAEKPEELPDAIRRAVTLPEAELRRRREKIWGGEVRNGAECLTRELRRLGAG